MALKRLGSAWGGWVIDIDLIENGDKILSAGLAHDITFEEELLKLKDVKFVGVDMTDVAEQHVNMCFARGSINSENYKYIKAALTAENADSVIVEGMNCRGAGLKEFLDSGELSMIKLDIEGSEYNVFDAVKSMSVKQAAVEFHHWVPHVGKKLKDSLDLIEKIKTYGYKLVFHNVNVPERQIQECLFIRNDLAGSYEEFKFHF